MKIITVNLPKTQRNLVNEWVAMGLYPSHSAFYRDAIADHLEYLKKMKTEIDLTEGTIVNTVNLPSQHIQEMDDLKTFFYPGEKSRSELIRHAGMRAIEAQLEKLKEEPKKKTFQEELEEYYIPVQHGSAQSQYKAYKIVKK